MTNSKKESPTAGPQDRYKNIHKNSITEIPRFVNRELVVDNFAVDDEGNPYPKSKQVARCGNAVTPPVPCALVKANLPEMCGEEQATA